MAFSQNNFESIAWFGLRLLRQILQEREINTRMIPQGRCLIFTRDSYASAHAGRDPEKDDELKPERIEIPSTGQKILGFKAPGLAFSSASQQLISSLCRFARLISEVWDGPKDVWEMQVEELHRVRLVRTLDAGHLKPFGSKTFVHQSCCFPAACTVHVTGSFHLEASLQVIAPEACRRSAHVQVRFTHEASPQRL